VTHARSSARPRVHRFALFLVVAAVGALAAVVASVALAPASVGLLESGVRVDVRYSGGDRGEIVAIFRPVEAGFHLYGPELPREGIGGAGRPTLLEVKAGSAWRVTGPLVAEPSTTPMLVPTFDRAFPIFPEGPATLRLPIERDTAAPGGADLTVSVTYMACSFSGLCLAPVIAREISVPIRS
jgi:hypothetical protein